MDEDKDMEQDQEPKTPLSEKGGILMEGHIRIFDPETGEDYVNKRNAIHYENMSEALALSVANKSTGFIHEMAFGNGGTSVDPTGVITYLPANSSGSNATLYNQTYYKVVDNTSSLNTAPGQNKLTVSHVNGNIYTDILVSCMLDYGEPSGQQVFDNTSNFNEQFTFDELGLKSWVGTVNTGKLLTHVVFHPVQKSLNRLIQIDYTIRVQTLTNLTAV
jgi:hypothetical protein